MVNLLNKTSSQSREPSKNINRQNLLGRGANVKGDNSHRTRVSEPVNGNLQNIVATKVDEKKGEPPSFCSQAVLLDLQV
jgi:hypothetical protein